MKDQLVGKYVLVEGDTYGSVVNRRCYKVLSVSKARVYLKGPVRIDLNGVRDYGEDCYMSFRKIRYVFDNEDDAINAGQIASEISQTWWTEQRKAAECLQRNAIANLNGVKFEDN